MQGFRKVRRKPIIHISRTDHARLSALVSAIASRNPDISEELAVELDRARIFADGNTPASIVQMGSRVTFKPDTGEAKTVTLVYPADADISEGKISILTPVGTALLGLKVGQSIMWTARYGSRHQLSILAVHNPLTKIDREGRQAAETRVAMAEA